MCIYTPVLSLRALSLLYMHEACQLRAWNFVCNKLWQPNFFVFHLRPNICHGISFICVAAYFIAWLQMLTFAANTFRLIFRLLMNASRVKWKEYTFILIFQGFRGGLCAFNITVRSSKLILIVSDSADIYLWWKTSHVITWFRRINIFADMVFTTDMNINKI